MTREDVKAKILEIGIIPSIRVDREEAVLFTAETIAHAGIPIVEVTLTVPHAESVIGTVMRENPHMVVGAGTVLDLEAARRCVDAGVCFLTSTGLDVEIVEFAAKSGVVVLPGALTPTEVIRAWRAGADFVKVFPCAQMGGPGYIRALRAPLRSVNMIAAGGVTMQTAEDYIRAGAVGLGIGGELIPHDAIERRQAARIVELARRFMNHVTRARGILAGEIF